MAPIGTQYRQGDVLLVAEGALPPDLEAISGPTGNALALVPGTPGVGSHLLPVAPELRAYRRAGGDEPIDWLEIGSRGITLTHPEHAPLTLEPGIWRVVRQREYDPAAPASARHRRAAD
jgi:hypothetical protein